MLEDIAAYAGTVITEDAGLTLDNIQHEFLGKARRVIVGKKQLQLLQKVQKKRFKSVVNNYVNN